MTSLWDEVCALYAAPGVREACLQLQEANGVDVPLLLVVTVLARRGSALDDARLDALEAATQPWQSAVVAPLRAARRALRDDARSGDGLGVEPATLRTLKASVQTAELAAERIQIEALERMACDWPLAADPRPGGTILRLLVRSGVPFGEAERFADLALSCGGIRAARGTAAPPRDP